MLSLDEFKNEWKAPVSESMYYDQASLFAITKAKSARQVNRAIQYFWASMIYQIIVYAMLSHLLIRYGDRPEVKWACLTGLLLYLPFTFVLLRQFRRVALASPGRATRGFSIQACIQQQYISLRSFYRFKRIYEYGLIPLSTALGVWLLFRVYVPGGVAQHWTGAITTYLLALLACGWAIHRENRTHFEQPLHHLSSVLEEFNQ
ncbi:hypothetical protein GCM10028803_42020 [Larkinella knui]|uniref:Uncharacterized protein n=1 Tax=Larkinella knui TaxID=2025310 RepID=A0A3P1CNC5_9BACT|nr:hypothetical protein [Larkinella knui]RRB14831.1 hypothetical protein EHT87_09695 [Larkinella knui]